MRALWMTIAALAAVACGPSTTGSSEAGDGSGTSATESDGSTDGATITSNSTGADGTGADTNGADTSSGGTTDTGEFGELLPAEVVITEATCDADDIMSVRIEGYFDVEVDSCMPPPDVPVDDVVRISIDPWSQFPESFEVAPGGTAQVTYGAEAMVGTLELTVWAPGHPDTLILDVAGETAVLQGTMDLVPCTVVLDDCIPGG